MLEKNSHTLVEPPKSGFLAATWPDEASLAAWRAWVQGLGAREAVARYLGDRLEPGSSSRAVIASIQRTLSACARARWRLDLAEQIDAVRPARGRGVREALSAVQALRDAPSPSLSGTDEVERWLPARACRALRAAGVQTMQELAASVARRRRWYAPMPGLGRAGAARVESVLRAHPALLAAACSRHDTRQPGQVVSWEQLVLPEALDGRAGVYRVPRPACLLAAQRDDEAVQAWLDARRHPATARAYRREAERLLQWAVLQRGRALSSLDAADARAYLDFLRAPEPVERWVGPARPRTSAQWRPFTGPLSARSAAHALAVLTALFHWLVAQRYVLANPFAPPASGRPRVAHDPLQEDAPRRGRARARAFSAQEWRLLRTVAEGLEHQHGWRAPAAGRLRFLLDFLPASGLRAGELVAARLADLQEGAEGLWLEVPQRGAQARVFVPPLARQALQRYLDQRVAAAGEAASGPQAPLLAGLDGQRTLTPGRLWRLLGRFYATAARVLEARNPLFAARVARASTHWLRHSHAVQLLDAGADLETVRQSLGHVGLAQVSACLGPAARSPASQLAAVFAGDGEGPGADAAR